MGQGHSPIYPLHDPGGRLSGYVFWQDLSALTSAANRQQRLRDFAQPLEAFPTASPDEDLEVVLSWVGPALARGVLLMDGHAVVGILSGVDIARIAALWQTLGSRPGLAA